MSEAQYSYKFSLGKTIIIGLAFFSAEVAWSLYNAQVPLLLLKYIPLLGLIGLFMALDNIIGTIIQPIMGNISDSTRTKFGRRIPYLLMGIPLSALFFALIPHEIDFITLLIWMFFFGLSMGFWRSQAVSIMPDFVKSEDRSKGNAIINLMGGVAVAVGYGFSFLLDFFADIRVGRQVLFFGVSIIMTASLIILFLIVKEKDSYSYSAILDLESLGTKTIIEEKKSLDLFSTIKDIVSNKDKSTLFILLANFFWYVGYQGVLALISIYGENTLGYTPGLAGFIPFMVAVPLLITIYPLSFVPSKIGRQKAIIVGVILWILMLIVGFFLGLAQASILIIAIPLSVLGAGWALINTNSIVILWELAPSEEKIGTYTGLYYLFGSLAAILGPMIIGFLTDLFGMATLLLNAAFFFTIALICMFFVKSGEVELTNKKNLANKKVIRE